MWRLIILFLLVFFLVLSIYKLGKSMYKDKKRTVEVYDNSTYEFKKNRATFKDAVDVEADDIDNK